jgi:hypothetical protein
VGGSFGRENYVSVTGMAFLGIGSMVGAGSLAFWLPARFQLVAVVLVENGLQSVGEGVGGTDL